MIVLKGEQYLQAVNLVFIRWVLGDMDIVYQQYWAYDRKKIFREDLQQNKTHLSFLKEFLFLHILCVRADGGRQQDLVSQMW